LNVLGDLMQTVISKYSRFPRRREVEEKEETTKEEGERRGMKARYGIPSKSS